MLQRGGGDLAANGGEDLVIETSTANFRKDVIAESAHKPVLVDFWAPWCGPCKQLTPIIEKAVRDAGGKVKLAKLNIDEHPQIAGQLGIQSIPAVIAFERGKPVDGFMGALPESQVKGFIERLVGPISSSADELMKASQTALANGEIETAQKILNSLLLEEPENPKAAAALATLYAEQGEIDRARQILTQFPESNTDPALAAARTSLRLAEQAESVGDIAELQARVAADPKDRIAQFELALALNAAAKRTEAADRLLDIIKHERNWNDDAARKQLLQFFESWGPNDADTILARRKLSSLLFS